MVHRNGKHKLVGFVNLGETHDIMSKISGVYKIAGFNIKYPGYKELPVNSY